MNYIFEARTNNWIKEIVKQRILNNWELDIYDFLAEEKLEKVWNSLQWKLPKNITISWVDEYFLL